MVSNKFLYDDGEGDEVFTDEWAASGGISAEEVVKLERGFLSAIVSFCLEKVVVVVQI